MGEGGGGEEEVWRGGVGEGTELRFGGSGGIFGRQMDVRRGSAGMRRVGRARGGSGREELARTRLVRAWWRGVGEAAALKQSPEHAVGAEPSDSRVRDSLGGGRGLLHLPKQTRSRGGPEFVLVSSQTPRISIPKALQSHPPARPSNPVTTSNTPTQRWSGPSRPSPSPSTRVLSRPPRLSTFPRSVSTYPS